MTTISQKISALQQSLEQAKKLVAEGKVHPIVGRSDLYMVGDNGDCYLFVYNPSHALPLPRPAIGAVLMTSYHSSVDRFDIEIYGIAPK